MVQSEGLWNDVVQWTSRSRNPRTKEAQQRHQTSGCEMCFCSGRSSTCEFWPTHLLKNQVKHMVKQVLKFPIKSWWNMVNTMVKHMAKHRSTNCPQPLKGPSCRSGRREVRDQCPENPKGSGMAKQLGWMRCFGTIWRAWFFGVMKAGETGDL